MLTVSLGKRATKKKTTVQREDEKRRHRLFGEKDY